MRPRVSSILLALTVTGFTCHWIDLPCLAAAPEFPSVTTPTSASPPLSTDSDWRDTIKSNAAYLRTMNRPPFRMSDPAGYGESEHPKEQQRAAADKLRKDIASAFQGGKKVFEIPPGEYRFALNEGFALDHYQDFALLAYDATF